MALAEKAPEKVSVREFEMQSVELHCPSKSGVLWMAPPDLGAKSVGVWVAKIVAGEWIM